MTDAVLPDPKYGVTVKPATAAPDTLYWRITEVRHLTGAENMGNHHAYCNVVDEAGNRVKGARLMLSQEGQEPVYAIIDKPDNEAGTNFPLFSSNLASVQVLWPEAFPYPSDTVQGIRTTHPDEETGNTWGHHSFLTEWQLTKAGSEPDDEPDPIPVLKWRDKFSGGEKYIIREAKRLPYTPEALLITKLVKTLDEMSAEIKAVALALSLEAHERDHSIEAYQRELKGKAENSETT